MSTDTKPGDPGTELTVFVEAKDLIDIPALITEIDKSIAGAQEAYKTLPKIVDDATKEIHFKFKDQCALRLQQYKERRMPFTRKLNEIIKNFTSREAEYERLIKLTDDATSKWAREALARARAAQDEADAKLRLEQAKINLEGRIREFCRQRLAAMLDKVRGGAGALVDKVTKETFETTKTRLQTEPKWMPEMDTYMLEIPDWITDKAHFTAIVNEELPAIREEYITQSAEILKRSITILETAIVNKADAQALKEAEEQRAKEEDAKKEEELKRDLEAQQAIAEVYQEKIEQPKVRVKMKVEILDNEAWLHMISWWYKHDPEAKTKDLSKKTFLQCKTFCEKYCFDTGEFIEHASLQWVEDVKAR